MSCLNIRDMQGYLEDNEPSSLRSSVELHLAGCGKCQAVFHRLAATNRRVNIWLSELASPLEKVSVEMEEAYAKVMNQARADEADLHLGRLFTPHAPVPWYLSLGQNLRDLIRPEKARPFEVTSKPVPVKDIWGLYAADPRNRLYSVGIHAAAIAILLAGVTSPAVQKVIQTKFSLLDPNLKPFETPIKPRTNTMRGGGGGGAREPLPVTKGQLPKAAAKQFVPPMTTDHTPKLAIEATLQMAPDTPLPASSLNNWGDPLARIVNGSNGSGSNGGMGTGSKGGIGSGDGGGYGPGSNGGYGDGVYQVGRDVSAPIAVFQPAPEYSEEARKAKFSGSVMLSLVVDTMGRPREIRVEKGLGLGLDEKAVEAVTKWKFRPGMRGGVAVAVHARVEVRFSLL